MIWKWIVTRNMWLYEGEEIPKYFGFAYEDFERDTKVYYIIPINVILAFVRWVYVQIRYKITRDFQRFEYNAILMQAYKRGLSKGYDTGRFMEDHIGGVRKAFAEECERLGIPYNISRGF